MSPRDLFASFAFFAIYAALLLWRPRLCAVLGLGTFTCCAVDAALHGNATNAAWATIVAVVYAGFPLLVARLISASTRKA